MSAKFFNRLVAASVVLFVVVTASANTITEQQSTFFHFKEEVAAHPGITRVNEDTKEAYIEENFNFKKPIDGKHWIFVDFEQKECIDLIIETKCKKEIDELWYGFGLDEPQDVLDEISYEEKKEFIKEALMSANIESIIGSFGPFNEKYIKQTKTFLEELQCLTNLSFFTESEKYIPRKHYKISLCLGLLEEYEAISYALPIYPADAVIQQSLIIIDHETYTVASNYQRSVVGNTIEHITGHEILHSLGLCHVDYPSYKKHIEYPSMMTDKEGEMCRKQSKDSRKILSCMIGLMKKHPSSTDVKTLQNIFGVSLDKTKKCQKIRKEFKEKYKADIMPTRSVSDESFKVCK